MRRKGIPCGPDCCSPSKHCVKAINNVSPDPNGDLTLKAGNGITIVQSGDDEITIINSATPSNFIAGNNIEFNPSGDDVSIDLTAEPVVDGLTVNGDVSITGDSQLNGDLEVNGDIIQNGAAYETHAQHIYTADDYIIMRDGAISALSAGDFSGFQVKKYDGTNDGRLVIDKDGTARVGDVGDEQPLLTRDESASLNNGDLLQWNSTSQKAVSASLNTSQIVRGSGNIGSDLKPIKVVNGVATAITYDIIYEKMRSPGPNGGIKLSDGLTLNWGYNELTIGAGQGVGVYPAFAESFTSNTSYQVMAGVGNQPGYFAEIAPTATPNTGGDFLLYVFNSSPAQVTIIIRWIAIGL